MPICKVPPLMLTPPLIALFVLSRISVPLLTITPPEKSSPPTSESVRVPLPSFVTPSTTNPPAVKFPTVSVTPERI